jgi:hypothetical protein
VTGTSQLASAPPASATDWPSRAPGCTCIHAAHLHRPTDGILTCRVGWSGAGELVDGTSNLRHWPSGCPCTAPQANA